MYDIIEKKKMGCELSKEEIQFIIDDFTKGNIPDYQMSAFLMAVYFKGMSEEETLNLTISMAVSGEVLDLSKIDGIKVDKHSTGGVGDKTSLILGPMVATLGIPVAKMAGRGLGHTGGTIDKLESFKGFTADVNTDDFINYVNETKLAIIGQTADLVPADRKLYALRDVTATVDHVSLIASSIMSKKLASGADAIVLDVKTGSGAFAEEEKEAIELATAMVKIGNSAGKYTIALVTNMDEPLGYAIGNALEVKEAIDTLNGEGSKDLLELAYVLGSYMVVAAKKASEINEARAMLEKTIEDKSALNKLAEFIRRQGGDESAVFDTSLLPTPSIIMEVQAETSGFVEKIDTKEIGKILLILGGAREIKASQIDLSVGLVLNKKVGDKVEKDDVIATIYANDIEKLKLAKEKLEAAYYFTVAPTSKQNLIKWVVTKNGARKY